MRPATRLFLVFAIGSVLFAQTSGEITGTVSDTTGAVVAEAQVTVTNTATSQVRRVVTNATGNYSVPFLTPGVYQVRAEKTGFKSATRGEVNLQVGDIARVDFTVTVGEVSETIEVQAGAALLTTENAAVGTVIENRRILDLPLNGRNYLQMVALSPNVAAEQGAGGEAAVSATRRLVGRCSAS
jgi:hypothetical protein